MEICYDGRSYTKVVFQCFFGRFWELIRVYFRNQTDQHICTSIVSRSRLFYLSQHSIMTRVFELCEFATDR